MATRTAPTVTGSPRAWIALTNCTAMRHKKAKATGWSRFETKIAAFLIELAQTPDVWGYERKGRAELELN